MQSDKKQSTRTAMLAAAERLFAERGLRNVKSKDILRAAGARNESALQYHFGDMLALRKEVFGARFRAIESARLDRFAALDKTGQGTNLEAVVRASVAPFFEACADENGRLYARFCVQFSTDPGFNIAELANDIGAKSLLSMRQRIVGSLQHLPADILATRLRLGFAVSLIQVADYARRIESGTAPPLDDAVNEAAASLCGFLKAPPFQ